MTPRLLALLPACLALGLAGCGEKGPPPGAPLGNPAPVTGRIVLPGGAVMKGGMVNFYPVVRESGGKLRYDGGSLVDARGEYVAGRNGDRKGLVPGEYVVTVGPRELGELPGSNASSVPQSYRDPKTSPLKVTVTDGDNAINIPVR
jgi:hypothetical protein